MLRIGTGIARGRRLKSVTGAIRPTGSRVRGSLFDSLSTRIVDGTVLDLCAGSGILGIEALSRGARCCLFVDNDRRAVRMIRDNLDRCGFADPRDREGSNGQGRVWMTDAVRCLGHLADHSCAVDIILADPPYGDPVAREIIRTIGEGSVLAPGGLLVLEHRGDDPPETCAGLDLVRRRDIGDTALSFFRPDWSAGTARSALSGQPVPAATVNQSKILPIDLPPPSSRTRR
jgi:16S rRNA (guanine966-N2)-methyltransferase